MSYADKIASLARRPLNILRLDLDHPIDSAGDYFCDYQNPLGQKFWPCIESIDYTPAKLIPGSLGSFGSVTIKLTNFPYGDAGTFFGRLLASNEYFLDRALILYVGFHDEGEAFDWANFQERHFVIRSIKGPDPSGVVTVTGTDILTLLDSDQSVVPLESYGELAGALAAATTGTVNITDNTNFDAGGGVCIINGKELATYSGLSGGTSIVITARSQFGTVAESSTAAGSSVRNCYYIDSENCIDALYALIDNFTEIDAATYINLVDWEDERDTYLASDDVFRVITEPTAVKDVIKDICESSHVSLWWEPSEQLIPVRAVGPKLDSTMEITTGAHILRSGHTIDRDLSKAITQVWVFYDKINQADGDDEKNFRKLNIVIDNSKETAYGFSKIEKVYAGYLPAAGGSTATKIGQRKLASYGLGEIIYRFQLDAKDSQLLIGDNVTITSAADEDSDGNATSRTCMVIERDQLNAGTYSYKAQALGVDPSSNYAIVAINGTPDYMSGGSATNYAFIADTSTGQMSNGDPAYLIL